MNNLLEQNLLYLYKNNKVMFDKIQTYLNRESGKFCELLYEDGNTVNLKYTLQDEVRLLYSQDKTDIETWIEEHNKLKQGKYDVVMLGIGLTHHLARLIESNELLNFYLFEPSIDIFIEMLKVVDIEQLTKHPQIKLLEIGDDQVSIETFHLKVNTYSEFEKVDVYIPFYTDINPNALKHFYKSNYSLRTNQISKLSFEHEFGTLPYRNSIRNLDIMANNSTSIKVLKNKYRGCTALVVGAGPSLELDIDHIKENYEKFFIIAAGSSIQSLLHNGIKPHIIVSIDPSEANARVFKNIDTHDIPFVYVPQIYNGILQEQFSRLFYSVLDLDPITEYVFSDKEIDFKLVSTVSVTGTAIQFAKYIGARSIVFTGQDLSFPNENYYAKGATHLDEQNLKDEINSSELKVENVSGSFNRINRSMKMTLNNIETLISDIKTIKFINSSRLGAKIKGTEFLTLSDVAKDINTNQYDFSSLIHADREDAIIGLEYEQFINKIESVIETCDRLKESNNASLKLISKIDEYARKNPNKSMNTLAKLEQEFKNVTEDELFKTFVPRWNTGATMLYDQQVIKIKNEENMIGKAKLINQIVKPYIQTINMSLSEISDEFSQLRIKLTEGNVNKKVARK